MLFQRCRECVVIDIVLTCQLGAHSAQGVSHKAYFPNGQMLNFELAQIIGSSTFLCGNKCVDSTALERPSVLGFVAISKIMMLLILITYFPARLFYIFSACSFYPKLLEVLKDKLKMKASVILLGIFAASASAAYTRIPPPCRENNNCRCFEQSMAVATPFCSSWISIPIVTTTVEGYIATEYVFRHTFCLGDRKRC